MVVEDSEVEEVEVLVGVDLGVEAVGVGVVAEVGDQVEPCLVDQELRCTLDQFIVVPVAEVSIQMDLD